LVGKLVLKIPWKNLYSAPVEASLEGLFLLVVPNQEVKYDPAKEEKWREVKQAELQRVENKKKQEREKGEMGIILLLLLRGGDISSSSSSMLVIQ